MSSLPSVLPPSPASGSFGGTLPPFTRFRVTSPPTLVPEWTVKKGNPPLKPLLPTDKWHVTGRGTLPAFGVGHLSPYGSTERSRLPYSPSLYSMKTRLRGGHGRGGQGPLRGPSRTRSRVLLRLWVPWQVLQTSVKTHGTEPPSHDARGTST